MNVSLVWAQTIGDSLSEVFFCFIFSLLALSAQDLKLLSVEDERCGSVLAGMGMNLLAKRLVKPNVP